MRSFGFHDPLRFLEVYVGFFIHALSQVYVSGFQVNFLLFLDRDHWRVWEGCGVEDFAQNDWMLGV